MEEYDGEYEEMTYILIALFLIVYFGTLFWVLTQLMEYYDDPNDRKWQIPAAVGFAWLVFTVWGIGQMNSHSAPCAQYETRMMFNAATKTMMPAQFCVQEGEWVK